MPLPEFLLRLFAGGILRAVRLSELSPMSGGGHARAEDLASETVNGTGQWIAIRFMPRRYTSREPIKLAEEFGWTLVGVRGDHHNFKHPASRFIVTIVHPQKDVPVGRAVDTGKKIRLKLK